MTLENKNAVIYGGGGAIGGAVARAFAREGARVFLAGRTRERLEEVGDEIGADIAVVDALDPDAVAAHANRVVAEAGRIDIALNAVGILHVQGRPFVDLSLADFADPIIAFTRTNFVTAKAVAPHMLAQGAGVILTISTPGSRLPGQGYIGYGVTCGAVEAFSRLLAAELGAGGVRVVCLCPHAIPEALSRSYAADVFAEPAARAGVTVEAMLEGAAQTGTLLGRLPTLAEVADAAAFVASDRGGAMTGAIVNLTCGALVD